MIDSQQDTPHQGPETKLNWHGEALYYNVFTQTDRATLYTVASFTDIHKACHAIFGKERLHDGPN